MVFFDEHAIWLEDEAHSESEDRFLLLGLSFSLRSLVVSHCLLEAGRVIRIIGARQASKNEERQYWERRMR
jgi:uncharacterized DUF497 family protein